MKNCKKTVYVQIDWEVVVIKKEFHAILNGFKHHPVETVGGGVSVLGLAAREGLLDKQHTTTIAVQQEEGRTFLFKSARWANGKDASDLVDRALKKRVAEAKSQLDAAKQHHHDLKVEGWFRFQTKMSFWTYINFRLFSFYFLILY